MYMLLFSFGEVCKNLIRMCVGIDLNNFRTKVLIFLATVPIAE